MLGKLFGKAAVAPTAAAVAPTAATPTAAPIKLSAGKVESILEKYNDFLKLLLQYIMVKLKHNDLLTPTQFSTIKFNC
jgi:hypothetical protein